MIRLPKWSLRYKFIVPLALFTVIMAISISYIAFNQFYAELEDQLYTRGKEVSSALITRQWGSGVATNFNTPYEEIKYIQVVEKGVVAYSTFLITPPEIVEILPPPRVGSHRIVRFEDKQYLEVVSVPDDKLIPDDAKGLANYVRLYLSFVEVDNSMQRAYATLSLFTILFILVGIGIAIWLYKGILGPVEVLTGSLKRFKKDMQTRALVSTGDELQTLAEEFNRMADTIQERDERLERINIDLTKANQVKSEFLAVMGHELKTPLHTIRGYSQLMLEGIEGPVTAAQREDLENIVRSSDHLRVLIDNILQFSKLESGQETIHPEELEVSKIVDDAMKHVSVLARERGVAVHASTNGIRIRADETKLKQVLINLLSNGLKYTKEGSVEVTTKKSGSEVVFAVRDTGVGIPRDQFENIFEPFTQLDSSSTREWGGIGLGLSIVKKYVEMHGGRIWLESEVGRGSTFFFSIPLQTITTGGGAYQDSHR